MFRIWFGWFNIHRLNHGFQYGYVSKYTQYKMYIFKIYIIFSRVVLDISNCSYLFYTSFMFSFKLNDFQIIKKYEIGYI